MDYDVAVVGGGINGVGVAREAAYRGYRTILLEQGDFAQATSSQSTKMIHGGIRYLETGEFRLVYESLHERRTLLRIAPHLVKPLELMIPVYKGSVRPLWTIRLGTMLYDLLAGRHNLERSRYVPKRELRALPGLRRTGLRGAVAYHDAQVFDSRLCLETALSAREAGATVANHHAVRSARVREGGYLLEVADRRRERGFTVTARTVVNATGPWSPLFERETLGHETLPVVYDRGVHLVVPHIGVDAGLVLQGADRRIIFILPWRDNTTLVGTTETRYEGRDFSPLPHSEAEVDYLLERFNGYFPERPIGRDDIRHIYSGVRTLVARDPKNLSNLSREAEWRAFRDGPQQMWITLYGGKLTSYRALAERLLKRLQTVLPRPAAGPERTDDTPLPGGEVLTDEPLDSSVPLEQIAAWQDRYGSRWTRVAALARADPALAEPLVPRFRFTRADVLYMVDVEMAHHLDDVILRRTTLTYALTPDERDAVQRALDEATRRPGAHPLAGSETS